MEIDIQHKKITNKRKIKNMNKHWIFAYMENYKASM